MTLYVHRYIDSDVSSEHSVAARFHEIGMCLVWLSGVGSCYMAMGASILLVARVSAASFLRLLRLPKNNITSRIRVIVKLLLVITLIVTRIFSSRSSCSSSSSPSSKQTGGVQRRGVQEARAPSSAFLSAPRCPFFGLSGLHGLRTRRIFTRLALGVTKQGEQARMWGVSEDRGPYYGSTLNSRILVIRTPR